MRPQIMVASLLIALGIAAFALQGITYTTRENVVALGPVRVTAEKTRTLAPVVGASAVVGGVVLLVVGRGRG